MCCLCQENKCIDTYSHEVAASGLHTLLCLVNLLLLHLKHDLEEVPHGHHHLARRLLGLDPEEPVAVLWTPVDVTERPVVGHVLRDEADLVYGVMVKTVLRTKFEFKLNLSLCQAQLQIRFYCPQINCELDN